jgi:hypothetical protein
VAKTSAPVWQVPQSCQQVPQLSSGLQTPSPHAALQSLSFPASHPVGQHPSLSEQLLMLTKSHEASQLVADPVKVSDVQLFPSLQLDGQLPSHVSPTST